MEPQPANDSAAKETERRKGLWDVGSPTFCALLGLLGILLPFLHIISAVFIGRRLVFSRGRDGWGMLAVWLALFLVTLAVFFKSSH